MYILKLKRVDRAYNAVVTYKNYIFGQRFLDYMGTFGNKKIICLTSKFVKRIVNNLLYTSMDNVS